MLTLLQSCVHQFDYPRISNLSSHWAAVSCLRLGITRWREQINKYLQIYISQLSLFHRIHDLPCVPLVKAWSLWSFGPPRTGYLGHDILFISQQVGP